MDGGKLFVIRLICGAGDVKFLDGASEGSRHNTSVRKFHRAFQFDSFCPVFGQCDVEQASLSGSLTSQRHAQSIGHLAAIRPAGCRRGAGGASQYNSVAASMSCCVELNLVSSASTASQISVV